MLAAFAAAELAQATERPVVALEGGTAAWRAAGLALDRGAGESSAGKSGTGRPVHPPVHPMEDHWPSPYAAATESERVRDFQTYLDWELQLVAQLERDGTSRFTVFPLA